MDVLRSLLGSLCEFRSCQRLSFPCLSLSLPHWGTPVLHHR